MARSCKQACAAAQKVVIYLLLMSDASIYSGELVRGSGPVQTETGIVVPFSYYEEDYVLALSDDHMQELAFAVVKGGLKDRSLTVGLVGEQPMYVMMDHLVASGLYTARASLIVSVNSATSPFKQSYGVIRGEQGWNLAE